MSNDIVVAIHTSLNAVRVTTVLRGERYISEAEYTGAVIGRAENTDRFWAGCAHMAFYMSWQQASTSNLAQAALEAREEGYAR